MTDQITARAVPVDYGIRIPRDGVTVVVLDAKPVPADVAAALDHIATLFGAPARTEREP
jgi:hypothetical protein